MDTISKSKSRRHTIWLGESSGAYDTFKALVGQETRIADWPAASAVEKKVPIYSGETVRAMADDPEAALELMAEWNEVFESGPGVIVIKGGMPDLGVVDAASDIFARIIESERDAGTGGGDHFAKPGANDRVWNAAEKHCRADPENFAAYYASDGIALAARSWLGRGYQLTAQVNRVNPGGAAQTAHRDYHLGFMNAEQLATYPVQAHRMSPALTLQGAVAHCDMPLESGPTMLLPYSQCFLEGYVAFNRPEYQEYFANHHIQLPLEKGDLLFFSPAVMHGAGTNQSEDILRLANLLQIGSAFGRSIESVNRSDMSKLVYPVLQKDGFSPREVANVIAASAEGYAFPTNLDRDPPIGGLIPLSPAEQMQNALDQGMRPQDWNAEVDACDLRRMA